MPDHPLLPVERARTLSRPWERPASVQAGRTHTPDRVKTTGKKKADQGRLPIIYGYLCSAGVALTALYYLFGNPGQVPPSILWLSAASFVLGCVPMLVFLLRGRTHQIPFLEAHALFYAFSFGFAGFQAPAHLPAGMTVDWHDIEAALGCTLFGLSALLAAYYGSSRIFQGWLRPIRPLGVVGDASLAQVAAAFLVLSLISEQAAQRLDLTALSQVNSMFFVLGFFTLFVLAYEKRLSPPIRAGVIFALAPAVVLLRGGLRTGQLAGVVTLVFWMSIVIVRTRRRIPFVLLGVTVVMFLVLQPVKFFVRDAAWGESRDLSLVETAGLYVDGFYETYGSVDQLIQSRSEVFQVSFDRVNHLVTTAAIIHDTPSSQPFLRGESYLPLLTKWIPRFLWADKPSENFGNLWAVKYGYLNQNDNVTSFNLPWLPEMYMNFGFWGVVGIMFLIGVFYQILGRLLMADPRSPMDCAIAIVFAQSLVFTESNLSLMLGGPIIFAISLLPLRSLLVSIGAVRTRN